MQPAVFKSPSSNIGTMPAVFDILAPDRSTSLLPDDLKLVLHINPSQLQLSYSKNIVRISTMGGWVEQHWGDAINTISLTSATGGFMRLYSGLSNTTNPDLGGTRRQTIAYDKYLDFLALFHNNGSVYDTNGTIVLQGAIKLVYQGGIYIGWFNDFSVTESATKPFQFDISATFTVDKEVATFRTTPFEGFNTSFRPFNNDGG